MPIYQYACKECGTEFEKRQSFNADTVTECPACQHQAQRVITPVGIIFKGSGFYVTDNKNGKGKNNGSGKSTGGNGSGSSNGNGAEKTSAKKTETSKNKETKSA